MAFISAEWRKLILANYVVGKELIQPFVPPAVELDDLDGAYYISLVGFQFLNTQVLGLPLPFHQRFMEINLRIYVRRKAAEGWRHGVTFLRETVSKPLIAYPANWLYNEQYEVRPTRKNSRQSGLEQYQEYSWKTAANWQKMKVTADLEAQPTQPYSIQDFFTQREWGYAKSRSGSTLEYQVQHPRWHFYPVLQQNVEVDFGAAYPAEFAHLSQCAPSSVLFMEGSAVKMSFWKKI